MGAGADVSELVGAGLAHVGPTLQRTIGDLVLISFFCQDALRIRLPAFERKIPRT